MVVSQDFPASAAQSVVEGYCQDFIALAATLAQTLEQMRMRGLPLEPCRDVLSRTERGMRGLADSIREMLPPESTPHARTSSPAAPTPPASARPASPPPHQQQQPVAPARSAARPPVPAAPHPALVAPSPASAPGPRPIAAQPPAVAARTVGPARPVQRTETALKLAGTSETMPLLSVVQFLNRMRKNGTLHVRANGEHLTFEFVGGVIESTACEPTTEQERLGHILCEMFPELRMRLDSFLSDVDAKLGARRLGNVLVQKGLASNGQVMEALERQVQVRFRRATQAKVAEYEFEEGERVPGDGRIRVGPRDLSQGRMPKE
jgi:hypothetical protein